MAAVAETEPDVNALKASIARLERQNATLRSSYALARKDADQARQQLSQIRKNLQALGGEKFGDQEQRLIKAVAELDYYSQRLKKVEDAAARLAGATYAYAKTSISDDAQARAKLEVSLRELDKTLSLRHQPAGEIQTTLSDAKVVSIDSLSGMLVLNAGTKAGCNVGMSFQIIRGDQLIGEAVVCEVREHVAGALVRKLENQELPVRTGDSVTIKLDDQK